MAILELARPLDKVKKDIKLLIYGESGSGKTRFAASASLVPVLSPVVLVDLEAGTTGLRPENYPNLRVISVKEAMDKWHKENPKTKAAFPLYEWVLSLREELAVNNEVKTVVWDSITELHAQLLRLHLIGKAASVPGTDIDVPSWPDHNKVTNQIRNIVRKYRDLVDKNVIFTALERSMGQGEDVMARFGPALTPKLASEIAAFIDIVLHLDAEAAKNGTEGKRSALSHLTKKYIAKDRLGLLPIIMEEPSMAKIVAQLKIGG
jgi:hypothetical protein